MDGKEALANLADRFAIKKYDKEGNLIYWEGTIDREYITIERELKLLQLIKDKQVNINLFIGLAKYYKNENDIMRVYNSSAELENKLFIEETIMIMEWLNNGF